MAADVLPREINFQCPVIFRLPPKSHSSFVLVGHAVAPTGLDPFAQGWDASPCVMQCPVFRIVLLEFLRFFPQLLASHLPTQRRRRTTRTADTRGASGPRSLWAICASRRRQGGGLSLQRNLYRWGLLDTIRFRKADSKRWIPRRFALSRYLCNKG